MSAWKECSFDLPIRSALVNELQVALPQVARDLVALWSVKTSVGVLSLNGPSYLAARETTDGDNHLDDLDRRNLAAIRWGESRGVEVSRGLPYKEVQVFLQECADSRVKVWLTYALAALNDRDLGG